MPGSEFICFSDVELPFQRVPLVTDWPAWWAKMEIYGSSLQGPLLVMDLDTVILGKFEPSAEHLTRSWVMRHFTRDGFAAPEEFSCGIMLVTEDFRRKVFEHFSRDPAFYMRESLGDDQKYFKKYWGTSLERFQDAFPDQFVSFKLHVAQHGLREDNVFVNFHGLPRPWQVKESWIPEV
jgi:hypothetical protein